MKRILCILLPALLAAGSCKKSSSDDEDSTPKYTSNTSTVLVSSFSLKADAKVLHSLDSVHFTIDTERMMIYNADSLPQGTDVSRLQVTMTFGSTVSTAQFHIPNRVEPLTYRTSMTDSIDFSQGPVTLEVTSADGKYSRDYRVMVNVHKMEPDSIVWRSGVIDGLGLESGATVMSTSSSDGVIVLATKGSTARLARTWSLASPSWQVKDVTLPRAAVRDLAAVGGTLYCLGLDDAGDDAGDLLKSDDGGETWTGTGERWHTIIGNYDERLLGVTRGDNLPSGLDPTAYFTVEYPAGAVNEVQDGFPIDGMSAPVKLTSSWSVTPYIVIAGGKTAGGNCISGVWAFDGETWGLLSGSTKLLPQLSGMTIVPYYDYDVNVNNYSAKRRNALYVFGGTYSDGAYNTQVFVSVDNGLTWAAADDEMQMPAALYDKHFVGRAYVESVTMSRGAQAPRRGAAPVTPVTSWDCPHIYGVGMAAGGVPMTIDGVYLRMMFVPVY